MGMSDTRLRHVVAVARLGSFSKAGDALGLTQSAITKSVAEVERQLGYPLFARTSRGAQMTEDGRNFVNNAAHILSDLDELFAGARGGGNRYAGPLRIGICPASLEWMLTEPCVKLLRQHSDVRLEIVGGSSERIVEMLRQGRLDLAVGPLDTLQEWREFSCAPIASVLPKLFVRKGHPLASGTPISFADLAKYEIIVPLPMQPYLGAISAIYEDVGQDWTRKVHLIDYFPVVKRLVLEFGLIGVVAESYGMTKRFAERFDLLSQPNLFPPITFCCAFRARWIPKPAAVAFGRIVRAILPPPA